MSVNAASGHLSRAQVPTGSAFVAAKPEQQRTNSLAPQVERSAFVPVAAATPAAQAGLAGVVPGAAGATLDVKL